MVSDVIANVRPRHSSGDLRMLNPVERKAALMAWGGADLVDIATETGMPFQHVREAVALQAKWRREPPPPGWDPGPQPEPVPDPDPDPDPDPLGEVGDLSSPLPVYAGGIDRLPAEDRADLERGQENIQRLLDQAQAEEGRDAELEQLVQPRPAPRPVSISMGGMDIAQTVRAGERSDDAHARALAGRIRRQVNELSAYLATKTEIDLAHQRISTLQDEVESLKRIVRHRESHRPANARAAAREPTAPVIKATDDMRYSTTVRDWARLHGLAVADRGRIANSVVQAYLAAHPAER